MGYVCGYNDGGGGASGGSWLDDIPLIKKYNFVGTDCAVGIADPESDKVKIAEQWGYYVDGDDTVVMDRIKWYPTPNIFYKPIIVIFFIKGKAVGYYTPDGGISCSLSYSNAATTLPYSDTWVLYSKDENFYDELKIEVTEEVNEASEHYTAKLLYKYHSETWNSSSGKTVTSSATQRSRDILYKSRDTYSSGAVRVSLSSYIQSQVTGIGMQWIKPEYLRDVLDAWFKCTNLEEVTDQ